MQTSSRFTFAIHTLTMLAMTEGKNVPSDFIAESAKTNPVVIRRIMLLLKKAGLIKSQQGVHGGAVLLRKPENITLLDIYKAVEYKNVFSLHPNIPNPQCIVGRNIQNILGDIFNNAENAMESVLAGISIAQIKNTIHDKV
ncbi:MAG: transcriptional regulator [Planctomycetia bacterium]|nr:transcriptional regulator [Planctomycetia bacterium]